MKLDEMERIAREANDRAPGKWRAHQMQTADWVHREQWEEQLPQKKEGFVIDHSGPDDLDCVVEHRFLDPSLAKHIATFSPDVVLKLIARIRELEMTATQALDGWLSLTNRTGIPSVVEREHVSRIAELRKKVPR